MKPIAEALLARVGPAGIARALGTARSFVLAYHNVLPRGARPGGDASLHVRRERFSRHLDVLQEMTTVVPLAHLLDEGPGEDGETRVAVTFDDGYRGALTVGLEELRARGLPATFFVCPGMLGDRAFWWDRVVAPEGGPLTAVAREVAVEVCRGSDDRVLAWASRHALEVRDVGGPCRTVTPEELSDAAREPGVTLGSHGWSHVNLAAVSPDERMLELRRSLAWLAGRHGPLSDSARSDGGPVFIPVMSYPYGRWSDEVLRDARAAGYSAGLRVDGGGLRGESRNPLRIPRLNVPSGLSPDGLRLRLSGILS